MESENVNVQILLENNSYAIGVFRNSCNNGGSSNQSIDRVPIDLLTREEFVMSYHKIRFERQDCDYVVSILDRDTTETVTRFRIPYTEEYDTDRDYVGWDFTNHELHDLYRTYTSIYFPFYHLAKSLLSLSKFVPRDSLISHVRTAIIAGCGFHKQTDRSVSGLFHGDVRMNFTFNYENFLEKVINVEDSTDCVNNLVDILFKQNVSYERKNRTVYSRELEMSCLFDIIDNFGAARLATTKAFYNSILSLVSLRIGMSYFNEIEDFARTVKKCPTLYVPSSVDIYDYVKNVLRYESSYYFDDSVSDINDSNLMVVAPAQVLSGYDHADEFRAMNTFVGGYLSELDLSKSMITGSAVCAVISALSNHVSPKVLFDRHYPSTYTKLVCDKEDFVVINVLLRFLHKFYPNDVSCEFSDDCSEVSMTLLPDVIDKMGKKEHIDFLHNEIKYLNINEIKSACKRYESFKFKIVPGVDVDIAIDTQDKDEFTQICQKHYEVIKSHYPSAVLTKIDRSGGSFIYEVTTENMLEYIGGFRNVQLFMCNRLTIAKFHLPMVRGWFTKIGDGLGIRCTRSCAWSHRTHEIVNMHFFSTNKNKLDILIKYMDRGFTLPYNGTNRIIHQKIDKRLEEVSIQTSLMSKYPTENNIIAVFTYSRPIKFRSLSEDTRYKRVYHKSITQRKNELYFEPSPETIIRGELSMCD